jgi:2-polyprenyl-6-methoxyphenol hydroxylase-like FAD-dependent oxidoreductase
MPPGIAAPSGSTTFEVLPATGRGHVVGAGPVGLLLTALLQSMEGFSVRLHEKRREYSRTRMVQLAEYLVADSAESYRTDYIDGDNVEAIFDPQELDEGLAFTGVSVRSTPSSALLAT